WPPGSWTPSTSSSPPTRPRRSPTPSTMRPTSPARSTPPTSPQRSSDDHHPACHRPRPGPHHRRLQGRRDHHPPRLSPRRPLRRPARGRPPQGRGVPRHPHPRRAARRADVHRLRPPRRAVHPPGPRPRHRPRDPRRRAPPPVARRRLPHLRAGLHRPGACPVSAADLLRTALDDAPTMRVEEDAYRDLAVWDHNDDFVLGNYSAEGQVALRLVGLLLAAAPHL